MTAAHIEYNRADGTPGPWRVESHTDARYSDLSTHRVMAARGWMRDDGTFSNCLVAGPIDSEADARLIAAAPDLLAALETVEWGYYGPEPMCPLCGAHREEDDRTHHDDCDIAAAIRSARGE